MSELPKLWREADHTSIDQLKRQTSASKIKQDSFSIGSSKKSGDFHGSHGDYRTTLSKCECYDFESRGIPCKHMYRLASELSVFDISPNVEYYTKIQRAVKSINTKVKEMTLEQLQKVKKFIKEM